MRWMVMVMVVACGASSAELKTAQTATYNADPHEVFRAAATVTAETYKIAETDDLQLITVEQWYSPEGGRESTGAGDFVQLVDRSIRLQLVVEVDAPANDRVRVIVTPKTFQHLEGSPKPRELAPDDPNVPSWVHGRVDDLQLAIYKRLQQSAVN